MADDGVYRNRIAQSVIEAVLKASRPIEDPKLPAAVNADAAAEGLIIALATLVHQVPECARPQGVRRLTKRLEQSLFKHIRDMQRFSEGHGENMFSAVHRLDS